MALNVYLVGHRGEDEEGDVWEQWATVLDAHAWIIAQAYEEVLADTAALFQMYSVQYLLDSAPSIAPELLLAIFWLIRREQLMLVPVMASARPDSLD